MASKENGTGSSAHEDKIKQLLLGVFVALTTTFVIEAISLWFGVFDGAALNLGFTRTFNDQGCLIKDKAPIGVLEKLPAGYSYDSSNQVLDSEGKTYCLKVETK